MILCNVNQQYPFLQQPVKQWYSEGSRAQKNAGKYLGSSEQNVELVKSRLTVPRKSEQQVQHGTVLLSIQEDQKSTCVSEKLDQIYCSSRVRQNLLTTIDLRKIVNNEQSAYHLIMLPFIKQLFISHSDLVRKFAKYYIHPGGNVTQKSKSCKCHLYLHKYRFFIYCVQIVLCRKTIVSGILV